MNTIGGLQLLLLNTTNNTNENFNLVLGGGEEFREFEEEILDDLEEEIDYDDDIWEENEDESIDEIEEEFNEEDDDDEEGNLDDSEETDDFEELDDIDDMV